MDDTRLEIARQWTTEVYIVEVTVLFVNVLRMKRRLYLGIQHHHGSLVLTILDSTAVILIHKSFQEQAYYLGILSLCCNFTWDFVYGFVYPAETSTVVSAWQVCALVNLAVTSTAIWFAPCE